MSPKVTQNYKNNKIRFILESAKKVFIRKGFSLATMQDIVDECNISRGGLYRYYSSTDEIFKAMIEDEMSDNEDVFSAQIDSGMGAADILRGFFEMEGTGINNIRDTLIPASYEFFLQNLRGGKQSEYLSKRHNIAVEAIKKVIEYGITKEEFSKKVDSLDVSIYIVNSLEGLIVAAMTAGIAESCITGQISILNECISRYLKR